MSPSVTPPFDAQAAAEHFAQETGRLREEAARYRTALRAIATHRPYIPEKHPSWQRCVDIAEEALR